MYRNVWLSILLAAVLAAGCARLGRNAPPDDPSSDAEFVVE